MELFKLIITIIFSIVIILLLLIMILYWVVTFLVEKAKAKKTKNLAILSARSQKGSIMFLGDSLTDFYPIEEFLHGFDIYNRGIAGDTTDNVLKRLESTVYPLSPRTIFLQIGTNDLGVRKSPEYTYNNIIKVIEEIKANIPHVIINVVSLYPVNPKAFIGSIIFVGLRKNKDIEEINKNLEVYCNNHQINFINVYPLLLDENGFLDKKYTIEGLHLSYEGYIVLTKALYEYVKEA